MEVVGADSNSLANLKFVRELKRENMIQMKVPFLLLFVLFACALAWGGGGQGPEQNFGGRNMMSGGGGFGGGRGSQPQYYEGPMGPNGRQFGGSQGDSKKYRSNLFNDDDVYGYDANYPNGEVAYINYRSKDARARRGPEFARTSRAYSRQGAGGERSGGSFGQMNGFGGGMW